VKKKIIMLVFGLGIAAASAFAQIELARVFETSNDFAEIKEAFQRRLYYASSEYKYFFHQLEGFVINTELEDELFNKKARKAISKNQYFIFEASVKNLYYFVLVNKENAKAIAFLFSNNFPSWFQAGRLSSRDEIDKALADYPDL